MNISDEIAKYYGRLTHVRCQHHQYVTEKTVDLLLMPVSVLNTFSKIYERYFHNFLITYISNCLSEFVAAYRKRYSSSHVLIRLVENWKKELDNKKYVGAILMDLSKAFDCIPHELLIAKMDAHCFSENALTFFLSYLKQRKQNVQVDNTYYFSVTLIWCSARVNPRSDSL